MEWARAKSIIIILLAVLNAFLLSRIMIEYGSQGISKETIADMEKILQNRGVVVDCKIPLYDSDTPRLKFESGKLDAAALVEKLLGIKPDMDNQSDGENTVYENGQMKLTFSGPNSFIYENGKPEDTVNISDLSETEKYLKKFLKDRKLDNPAYILDGTPEKQGEDVVFTYLEKYKGFLVFDNYLKAAVTKKGIVKLEVSHKKITGFSPEKISDISTAYQILLEHFDGSDKAVITAIDLIYMDVGSQDRTDLQSSEELPVWRIKVNGAYRFFGASDGKEIK